MIRSALGRAVTEETSSSESIFEQCGWLYSFFREHLFRDHTTEIIRALFPNGEPAARSSILEVGCGPGYYARQLAKRFSAADVFGVDRSSWMVSSARSRAASARLCNCHFIVGAVESLSSCVNPVDSLISSRLFLVVPDPNVVLEEMFRVLKPGGRLFLAEPTADLKTRLPLAAMHLVASLSNLFPRKSMLRDATILSTNDFRELVYSQPWSACRIEMHGDYQCATCEKE